MVLAHSPGGFLFKNKHTTIKAAPANRPISSWDLRDKIGIVPLSGLGSQKVLVAVIVIFVLVFAVAAFIRVSSIQKTSSINATSTFINTSIEPFYYLIIVNYSGSWNLVYYGQNGTYLASESALATIGGNVMVYNFKGSLNGSGGYETSLTTYAPASGFVVPFCAKATKLDSQNLTLTLAVGGFTYLPLDTGRVSTTNSTTTASDPSAEVCL